MTTTVVVDAAGGYVAMATCGANPRRYSCWRAEPVRAVELRTLPSKGRRPGATELERAIWRGLRSAGHEHAYALEPCRCGHRREVSVWLTDQPRAHRKGDEP
jgi:hypothetical protein